MEESCWDKADGEVKPFDSCNLIIPEHSRCTQQLCDRFVLNPLSHVPRPFPWTMCRTLSRCLCCWMTAGHHYSWTSQVQSKSRLFLYSSSILSFVLALLWWEPQQFPHVPSSRGLRFEAVYGVLVEILAYCNVLVRGNRFECEAECVGVREVQKPAMTPWPVPLKSIEAM